MGLTLGDEQIYYNSQPSFKPPLPGLCSTGSGVVVAAVAAGAEGVQPIRDEVKYIRPSFGLLPLFDGEVS